MEAANARMWGAAGVPHDALVKRLAFLLVEGIPFLKTPSYKVCTMI